MKYGKRGYWYRSANLARVGRLTYSSRYGISLVRTGAELWADHYTSCAHEEQIELTNDNKSAPAKRQ